MCSSQISTGICSLAASLGPFQCFILTWTSFKFIVFLYEKRITAKWITAKHTTTTTSVPLSHLDSCNHKLSVVIRGSRADVWTLAHGSGAVFCMAAERQLSVVIPGSRAEVCLTSLICLPEGQKWVWLGSGRKSVQNVDLG